MNLYIIRHGEAVRLGGAVSRDADRTLTPRGEEDARRLGKALARIDNSVRLIMTSPLLRAVETGRLVGAAFASGLAVQPSDRLVPGFRHKALLAEIALRSDERSVALVAHQPDLTQFISWLIADDASASIGMPPGAAAHVRIAPPVQFGEATLRWLLTPEILHTLVP